MGLLLDLELEDAAEDVVETGGISCCRTAAAVVAAAGLVSVLAALL
jgi:hypothetical protein